MAESSNDALIASCLAMWRRHDDILLALLGAIPTAGWTDVPAGSRGRDVARQLAHLYRIRTGWVCYHETGKRPKVERFHKGPPPSRGDLRKWLKASGKEVEALLARALCGEAKIRMFGKDPLRWLGYLIEHEAHHRGQILLALKQSGHKLSTEAAMQGIWGRWISGE